MTEQLFTSGGSFSVVTAAQPEFNGDSVISSENATNFEKGKKAVIPNGESHGDSHGDGDESGEAENEMGEYENGIHYADIANDETPRELFTLFPPGTQIPCRCYCNMKNENIGSFWTFLLDKNTTTVAMLSHLADKLGIAVEKIALFSLDHEDNEKQIDDNALLYELKVAWETDKSKQKLILKERPESDGQLHLKEENLTINEIAEELVLETKFKWARKRDVLENFLKLRPTKAELTARNILMEES